MCLWHSYGPRPPDPPRLYLDSLAGYKGAAFVLWLGTNGGREDEQRDNREQGRETERDGTIRREK